MLEWDGSPSSSIRLQPPASARKTAASLCQMRKSAGLGTALWEYGSTSLLVKLHDSKLLNQAGDPNRHIVIS
mgnify:FL=1